MLTFKGIEELKGFTIKDAGIDNYSTLVITFEGGFYLRVRGIAGYDGDVELEEEPIKDLGVEWSSLLVDFGVCTQEEITKAREERQKKQEIDRRRERYDTYIRLKEEFGLSGE